MIRSHHPNLRPSLPPTHLCVALKKVCLQFSLRTCPCKALASRNLHPQEDKNQASYYVSNAMIGSLPHTDTPRLASGPHSLRQQAWTRRLRQLMTKEIVAGTCFNSLRTKCPSAQQPPVKANAGGRLGPSTLLFSFSDQKNLIQLLSSTP